MYGSVRPSNASWSPAGVTIKIATRMMLDAPPTAAECASTQSSVRASNKPSPFVLALARAVHYALDELDDVSRAQRLLPSSLRTVLEGGSQVLGVVEAVAKASASLASAVQSSVELGGSASHSFIG